LPSEAIVVEGDVLSTHFSSIELDDSACLGIRKPRKAGSTYRLITVASLEQPYKGVQHLLAAVDTCLRQGLDLELHVVGDGRYRTALEQRAAALGIKERVTFTGQLPAGQAVREHLDEADVFVLASLTEGLPRAMIEAMARGLPCIGTNVGGIPELLPEENMVLPGDAPALAAKISEVLSDHQRMASMSAVNLVRARNFSEPVLRGRRAAFYGHLQGVTEEWIAARSRECVQTPA
jgi:glycosyltransferase involved in cell wall biosynthesis